MWYNDFDLLLPLHGKRQEHFIFSDASIDHGGDMTGTLCSDSEYYLGNIVAYYKSKISEIEGIFKNQTSSLPPQTKIGDRIFSCSHFTGVQNS